MGARIDPPVHEIVLTQHEADQPLDRYLRKLLSTVSPDAVLRYVRSGAITIDGDKVDAGLRLCAGMAVQLRLSDDDMEALRTGSEVVPAAIPAPTPEIAKPRAFQPGNRPPGAGAVGQLGEPLVPRIVLADEQFFVVNKPAGMAMQGTGSHKGTVVDWLDGQRELTRHQTRKPVPVHRLDKGTSGLLVLARTIDAQRTLINAFRRSQVECTWFALVHGAMARSQGSITAPLLPDSSVERRDAKLLVDPRGEVVRTDYEVVRKGRLITLVRLSPGNGRQHPIRAHLAHLGHPIVGDGRYGSPADVGPGFLLHASDLKFTHPATGEQVHLQEPLPARFKQLFDQQ
jgi:RluA family pseudouridine synthase